MTADSTKGYCLSGTVMEGTRGVLETLRRGATWIEMSTTDIEQLRRLDASVVARGASTLECPVTGGVKNAYKGKITIFVAGERAVFEQRRPVLAGICDKHIFLGPLGAALTAKLITNMKFTVETEDTWMDKILNGGEDPAKVASDWLKANPTAIDAFLAGVTTFDGQPGADAVKKSLGT